MIPKESIWYITKRFGISFLGILAVETFKQNYDFKNAELERLLLEEKHKNQMKEIEYNI